MARKKSIASLIKRKRFVDGLMQGLSQKDACIAAGLKEDAGSTLMKDEEVITDLEERLNFEDTCNRARLRGLSDEAIDEFKKLLLETKTSPETKLQVILEILDRVNLGTTNKFQVDETSRVVVIGKDKKPSEE
jgi:hypothetical protein